jgi:probable HAF family extracellular repeat protein
VRSRTLTCITAMALFAALAVPLRLVAQEQQQKEHTRYKLIDIGTFGGPNSSVPTSFLPLNDTTGVQVISNNGTVTGAADTSTPDPLCFLDDCFYPNAFQWQKGVVTNLGTLPGTNWSTSFWISGNGLIAGLSENGETDPLTGAPEIRAVLWQGGGIVDLGTLEAGYESFAFAVNNRGQVVGAATNTVADPFSPFGTQIRAFQWEKGVMQDLGTLGGPEASAFFVNNRGQVAGFSFPSATPNSDNGPCGPNHPTQEPFLWEKGIGMIDIGNFGGTCGIANALNNRGQVAGQSYLAGNLIAHAFLWDKSDRPQLTDLGTLGGDNASGEWLNDAGEVVGYADLPPNPPNCTGLTCVHHGFLWKQGVMTDLGTIGTDPCSRALSINSKGQIVGATAAVCGGNFTHGFLWENGGPPIDLNTLVAPGSGLALVGPSYINDRGEIAGNGVLANGDTHAFVLIPCGDGDEGCEDDAAHTTAAAPVSPVSAMQRLTVIPDNAALRPQMMRLFGGRWVPWYRGFGASPQD